MPPEEELSPRARKLYPALQEHGNWISRAELARAMGQPRLTFLDTGAIEMMVQKDLIEIRKCHIPYTSVIVEYKVK